jgi:DNA-binding NtrC family response regulator
LSNAPVVIFLRDGSLPEDFWRKLESADLAARVERNPAAIRSVLEASRPAVCVCAGETPSAEFHDILGFINDKKLPTELIVSVRRGSVEDAVGHMKAGAHDFIISDDHGVRLVESILRTVTHYRKTVPAAHVPADNATESCDSVLVGQSSAMCEIRSAVSLIAKSQTTVLITGESGTGKEVVARLLHLQSPRSSGPCVTVNCAAIPTDVIENELFGHEKGAFTGALIKKPGCFELADRGTLLLDEIAEMKIDTQAKLLRAIETRSFRRLGGKEEIEVDVRLIAATNKDVQAALGAGELREDLYYRLSVIELHLPPVRERREDIPLLAEYFLGLFTARYGKAAGAFTPEALEVMKAYDWPGNVREIRNVVERAIVICPGASIGAGYLPERLTARPAPRPRHDITIPIGSSTQEAEKILILETLASAGYNKAKAARILGVSRKTLHNKLSGFQNP